MEPRPEVFVWRKDHSNPVVRCKYSLRPEVFVRRRVVLRKGFCGGRVGRRGGRRGGRCEAACMGRQGVWARSQGGGAEGRCWGEHRRKRCWWCCSAKEGRCLRWSWSCKMAARSEAFGWDGEVCFNQRARAFWESRG